MKFLNYAKRFKVLICLLISFCIIQQPLIIFAEVPAPKSVSQPSPSKGIDKGIANLNYDRNQILASNGDSIESFVPKEGLNSKDKFVVVERNKKSLTTSPVDISIIDSMTDRTYPGALQLADNGFVENQPNLLVCNRKPLNISIDLPGMKKENTAKVENPTYANVSGEIDGLISTWNEKYSTTHTLPARMQYSESMAYS
ncbi:thiol-activated cytolysin family protein, partial [Anaerotignum propionicum]|uniref:thiol-activated cytolysin family protein n=1 Tax=Anaerotignum propionicum TaxID=28446 RepID=UPI0028A25A7F